MKPKTLQVYLGWDSRSPRAFDVARASIAKRTKHPIQIIPIRLKHLDGILTRPVERKGNQLWCPISNAPMSTEFANSRFCVPFLQDRGWALFADCDILCWSNIEELFALADEKYAVQVVKHLLPPPARLIKEGSDQPLSTLKMDGQIQTNYSRKNWSSVVLWNLDHEANKRFTLENLNTWPGRDLHAFKWLKDSEVGDLPQKWNWLINVTPGEPKQEGIWHYTLGGPWFPDWKQAPYDEYWAGEALHC